MTEVQKWTLVFTGAFVIYIAFSIGTIVGMDRMSKIHDKVDCEVNYGYKPVNEIPGRCAKYFGIAK